MYRLSNTSKMPGKSFSLPAQRCKMGSQLAQIEGSVCSSCYALKGSYRYPTTMNLRESNYNRYMNHPSSFYTELLELIQGEYMKSNVPYFRWFDSGDLQSKQMFFDILRIAHRLPRIYFWLPTKELNLVKETLETLHKLGTRIPPNLSIRISVFMIDGKYMKLDQPYMESVVQTRVINKDTPKLDNEIICCTDCELCKYKCWDNDINVAYVKH